MRKAGTILTMLGIVVLVAVVSLAEAQPVGGQARDAQGRRAGAGWGVWRMGQPVGRLETTPETKELWQQSGDLQANLHQKQWELFELQNAEPLAPEAIETKQAEIREINQQMQQLRQQLAEHATRGRGAAGQGDQRRQALLAQMRQRWQQGPMAQPGMGPAPMGPPGMGPGPMTPPTIVIDSGKLYLVLGGQLCKFDADTLELEKAVLLPHMAPVGPPPFGPPGPPPPPPGQ